MKSKELKEIQNAAARKWFDNKTKENAENVIKVFEPLINWFSERKSRQFPTLLFDDFYSECQFGVYEALLKYDGERNFSSYVSYWIIRRMQLFVERMVSDLNYGRCDKRRFLLKHYKPLFERFRNENQNASIDEIHDLIAEKCDTTRKVVERMYWEKQQNKRIDSQISMNSNSNSHHDIIADENALTENELIDFIDAQKIKSKINKKFSKFNQQKLDIFWKCIIDDDETYESIGQKYGVSRQAIEQQKKRIEKSFERFKRAM